MEVLANFYKKSISRDQNAMIAALVCEKYNLLKYLISQNSSAFNEINFLNISIYSDTDKYDTINDFFMYKLKCVCLPLPEDAKKYINGDLYCDFTAYDPNMYCLKFSHKNVETRSKYQKIIFLQYTEEELVGLRWNNKKNLMLLGLDLNQTQ